MQLCFQKLTSTQSTATDERRLPTQKRTVILCSISTGSYHSGGSVHGPYDKVKTESLVKLRAHASVRKTVGIDDTKR